MSEDKRGQTNFKDEKYEMRNSQQSRIKKHPWLWFDLSFRHGYVCFMGNGEETADALHAGELVNHTC
jgi:hypothetical protein